MRRLLRKLAFNYSEGGLLRLCEKSLRLTRTTLFSTASWDIYVFELSRGLGRSEPLVGVDCRILTFQDLVCAKYYKAMGFPEEIQLRFDNKNICYGFYSNNELAVVGWSSDGYLELDHGLFIPCPSRVALFDFFAVPRFRGRGLYTNSLRHLVRVNKAVGRSVCIAVDPSNVPSVKGIRRAGFEPSVRVTRRRLLGLALVSRKPVTHLSIEQV